MTTLKGIALELLQKYEESETSVIWEYSGDIEKSEKYLDAEVAKYRELIDKYAEQEPTKRQSCENCKILEWLVGFELEYICEDDDKDFEYCENYCHFKAPTKECYLHWAEHKRKAVSKCHTV